MKTHPSKVRLLCLAVFLLPIPVLAANSTDSNQTSSNPISGRSIGVACAGCHGTDGTLFKPGLPVLKAEPSDRIYTALINFKTDKKRSTIMGRIAKGYTDVELRAVADYFSRLK